MNIDAVCTKSFSERQCKGVIYRMYLYILEKDI